MKYTQLGKSDLTVSRICLGTMGFGEADAGFHTWTLPYADSKAIIKQALDAGINFFDTAIAYSAGTSEQFLGRALRELVRREDVVVATKFSPRSDQDISEKLSGQAHVQRSLDSSLKNLGLDYVDLYIYHQWDYRTPIEEVLDGLNQAVQSGKVREIGISNCFAWQLAKANAIADAKNYPRFVSVQSHYNLIMREDERELLNYCAEDKIATTPYSALAAGRLSRLPGQGESKRLSQDSFAKFKYDATAKQDAIIIDRVAEVAQNLGVTMTEVAIAWLLTKVTAPVVGATKPHHIEAAVKAVDLKLTPEQINYLEEAYVPHNLSGVMAQNTFKGRA